MSSEVLQKLDLPERPFGENLLAKNIGDLFDRHTLAGLIVGCGTILDVSAPLKGHWSCPNVILLRTSTKGHTKRCHMHPAQAPL